MFESGSLTGARKKRNLVRVGDDLRRLAGPRWPSFCEHEASVGGTRFRGCYGTFWNGMVAASSLGDASVLKMPPRRSYECATTGDATTTATSSPSSSASSWAAGVIANDASHPRGWCFIFGQHLVHIGHPWLYRNCRKLLRGSWICPT